MANVQPVLGVLKAGQAEEIHGRSLEILARTGIRVKWDWARKLLEAGGCRPMGEDRMLIPAETVQWALDAAPPAIDVFNRRGEEAFTLGGPRGGRTRFGAGVTNLFYQDPMTDETTPFSLSHLETATLLTNQAPEFDLLSTPGIARELPPEIADLEMTLSMVAHSLKPMLLLVSKPVLFEKVLDLVDALTGGDSAKPFILPYLNPITPLVMNEGTLKTARISIERGLPVVYNSYGMAGATMPITPGGALALLNAELLAGLAYAQLVKEGAPIILGSLPAGFHMKAMMSVYTPRAVMLNLASAEMMDFYNLPYSGTSGSGPGWGPDLIAAGAFWLNHLTACIGKVQMAPFVGGNFDSLVFSPASVVLADQIIREARIFAAGFDLTEAADAVEEIEKIGPAGNFLGSDVTLKLFRQMSDESPIWPATPLDQWTAQGSPRADRLLREYTVDLLANLEPPDDAEGLTAKGREFIDAL